MTSNVLRRVAGWSGIASALVFILAFGLTASNAQNPTGSLGLILFAASNILSLPLLYGLFVLFRGQSLQAVNFVALIAGVVSNLAGIFGPTPDSDPLLFNSSFLLFCVSILCFGYLGYQNAKLPRAAAILALVIGILGVVNLILNFTSNMGDLLGLAVAGLDIVWSIWVGVLFLREKLI
jgi:uncharacterized membrane protein